MLQNGNAIFDGLHPVIAHLIRQLLLDASQFTPITSKRHAVALQPVEIDGDPIHRKFVLVPVEVMQRFGVTDRNLTSSDQRNERRVSAHRGVFRDQIKNLAGILVRAPIAEWGY